MSVLLIREQNTSQQDPLLLGYQHAAITDTRASLDLATKTTHVNTIVRAKAEGVAGNSITIAFVGDSGTKAGSIAEVGTAITIHYKDDTTLVSDIEALIATSTLIEVKTAGTAGNTLDATGNADTFTATALAGGSATTYKLWKADRAGRVDRISYVNPTGLAQGASNYFTLSVKKGSTVIGSWSTHTGSEGTLTADTFVTFTLSTTDADLVFAAGDQISFVLSETGNTASLPAGSLVIEGHLL